MMAALPKFSPPDTPIANYQQNAINWAFVNFKYGKPLGPDQKKYDPYYTYSITVNMNGQDVPHRWYATVDEHKVIQIAGAANGSLMAVTNVVNNNRKSLVAIHSSGPMVSRTPEQVEAEVNKDLAELEAKLSGGQPGPLPNVILPPQMPQAPAPPGAPTPPRQVAQAPQPPQPATPAPPPTPPPAAQPQATTTQPQEPAYEPPKQRVYRPHRNKQNFIDIMGEMAVDATYIRRLAYDTIEAKFEDALPEIPAVTSKTTVPQKLEIARLQMERVRLLTDLSAPVNMKLDKKIFHLFENGDHWVMGEEEPDPKTKDGALTIISGMRPDQYNGKTYISEWLKVLAEPDEHVGSWKHAANICKLFGLDTDVLLAEFDVDHMLVLTQAVWAYEACRQEGMNRNESLGFVAEEYGLPTELMDFEDEEESGGDDE